MLRQTRYRFPRENYSPTTSVEPVSLRSGGFMVEAKRAATYMVEFTTIMVGERYNFMARRDDGSTSDTGTYSEVKEIRLCTKDGRFSPLTGTDYSVEDYLLRHGGKLAVITSNNVYEIDIDPKRRLNFEVS